MFLYTGCLGKNQPESVLKLFVKLPQKEYTLCLTRGLIAYDVLLPTLNNTFPIKINKYHH